MGNPFSINRSNKIHTEEMIRLRKLCKDLHKEMDTLKLITQERCKTISIHINENKHRIYKNDSEIGEIYKILQDYNTKHKHTHNKVDKLQIKMLEYNLICDNRINTTSEIEQL